MAGADLHVSEPETEILIGCFLGESNPVYQADQKQFLIQRKHRRFLLCIKGRGAKRKNGGAQRNIEIRC